MRRHGAQPHVAVANARQARNRADDAALQRLLLPVLGPEQRLQSGANRVAAGARHGEEDEPMPMRDDHRRFPAPRPALVYRGTALARTSDTAGLSTTLGFNVHVEFHWPNGPTRGWRSALGSDDTKP